MSNVKTRPLLLMCDKAVVRNADRSTEEGKVEIGRCPLFKYCYYFFDKREIVAYTMSMGKKKYEKPSIMDPETGRSEPRMNYGPVGATGGCSFGDVGSACANGSSPSRLPNACHVGNTPKVLNCSAGTSASNSCLSGTDATTGCDTGTRDTSFCQNGATAQGSCDTGTSVL